MKRFWNTAINLVYPSPKQVEEQWQWSDWIALVVVCLGIAAIIGIWTGNS